VKRLLLACILLIGLGTPAWADFQAGRDAYERGEFAAALGIWRPLAKDGDARAQHWLGFAYAKGRGVAKDYARAATWFAKAAKHGHAQSQKFLGDLFRRGRGVTKNLSAARKWYQVAADQGQKDDKKALARLKRAPGPSGTEPIQVVHNGVQLIAFPPKADVKRDIELVASDVASDRIRVGLDYILDRSPFSTAASETLKKAGFVQIYYDPNFRSRAAGSLTIAVFLPEFYKAGSKDPNDRRFVVKIGPNGIKWPTDELAAIIVHELVGHGMQQFKGRWEKVRNLDLECEAYLYQEKFYQDIGIDKEKREVVGFRKALETHFCTEFKAYMRRRDASLMKMWDVLDPDVPKLLAIFEDYTDHLGATGVAAKAIGTARDQQRKAFAKLLKKAESEGDAVMQYKIGIHSREGVGTGRDPGESVRWLTLAARQGHASAQLETGVAYETGRGVAKDLGAARRWYVKAAKQGNKQAQDHVARLASQ
jgi:TPR repeat protein